MGLGREQVAHHCLVCMLLRKGVLLEGCRGGSCSEPDRDDQLLSLRRAEKSNRRLGMQSRTPVLKPVLQLLVSVEV